jgi:hypothetical protein
LPGVHQPRGTPAGAGRPLIGVRLQPPQLKALESNKQDASQTRPEAVRRLVELGLKVKEMTEQEELIQEIRERLGEMPKGALPFDLLAFATTIGQRYSMTQDEILPLVMREAEALGDNYHIGSSSR